MKHKIFIGIIVSEIVIFTLLLISGHITIEKSKEEITAKKSLVSTLMLTDFSVWTEARYTRHPSQADLFTPFQDYPASIEHFPAGSMLAPPESIRRFTKTEFRDSRKVEQ
jgi:hypothetical protein